MKKRAFLKWAGGKYSLIDDIKANLPQKKILVEKPAVLNLQEIKLKENGKL